MLKFAVFLVPLAIGWYTINIARNAWADGNKTGAVCTGILAAVAAGLPIAVVLTT